MSRLSPSQARRCPRLSRRKVRELVRLGQSWEHVESAITWRVMNVHRADGMVALIGPGARPRYVTFGELGHQYELLDEEGQ